MFTARTIARREMADTGFRGADGRGAVAERRDVAVLDADQHRRGAAAVYDFILPRSEPYGANRPQNSFVAPADGRIVEIRPVKEPHFLGGEAIMVAIFLSVFDVHVQRAPIDGKIGFVQYNKGKFLDARNAKRFARKRKPCDRHRIGGRVSRNGAQIAD